MKCHLVPITCKGLIKSPLNQEVIKLAGKHLECISGGRRVEGEGGLA